MSCMNEEKVNNLIKISKSCQKNLLNELISSFGEEALSLIAQIKKVSRDKDLEQLANLSRKLHLSADYMGAEKLSEICITLEKSALEGAIPRNIDVVISELEYFYYQSCDFLDNKKVA